MKLELIAAAALALAGCTTQQAKDVTRAVLTTENVACILATHLTVPREVAAFCKISEDLLPVIEPLVAAKQAGACKP